MNANFLKKIYFTIKPNRLRYLIVKIMRFLNLRYYVVRIDTNHLCNLRCKMCYFNNENAKRIRPMEISLYKKIIKEIFEKVRILYLSCYAEPLCTPNITDFLKLAKQFNVPFVSITSNCMLLSEEKSKDFVDNKLDELIVSICGGKKETYEENHLGAKWEKLWENLKSLDNYKRIKKSGRPTIKFNYILTKKSILEINEFIEKTKFLKLKYITLRELEPFEDMDSEFYNTNKLTPNDFIKVKQIKNEFVKNGIIVIDSLQCTEEEKPNYPSMPEYYPCIQPFFQLYIQPNGDLRFCLFREKVGNLKENSFTQILHSKNAERFFQEIKKRSTCSCLKECPNFNVDKKVKIT